MGIIILFALLLSLAVSLVLVGIAAVVLRKFKLDRLGYLLILGSIGIGLFGWLAYFNFLNWYNEIGSLEPSSQAAAVVPFVFALGLTPGFSGFAAVGVAILIQIYRRAGAKKE